MYRLLIVIAAIGVILLSQFAWAASSDEAKERAAKAQKQVEEMQKKQEQWRKDHQARMPKKRGFAGTFQAIKMSDDKVFILDTAGGHFWLWSVKSKKAPEYQGQIEVK